MRYFFVKGDYNDADYASNIIQLTDEEFDALMKYFLLFSKIFVYGKVVYLSGRRTI